MSLAAVKLPVEESELALLVDLLCEGTISPEQRDRLETILAADREAKLYYIAYLDLHAQMQWITRGEKQIADEVRYTDDFQQNTRKVGDMPFPPASSLPSLSTNHYPLTTNFVGGPVFSYMVATVVVAAMLLGAWAYKITLDEQLVVETTPQSVIQNGPREFVSVGRVTGMRECVWKDGNTSTIIGASVPLDRKYSLVSGLMEITYSSGAKMILEGPCEYTADSESGGYLRVGKLVARVEKKGERRGERGEKADGLVASATSAKPLAANPESRAPNPQPLFSVRTPTAVVTDLGTEFGVEVAGNGDTTSHVFSGTIKVRSVGGEDAGELILNVNESARVIRGEKGAADGVHHVSVSPESFVRHMPQWTPFDVFSTGVGVKEGDADPHWQIVARSDDPAFKPQPAVITSISGEYSRCFRQNDASRSQWISTGGDMPTLTEGITYSFRTTFELAGVLEAASKSIVLRGGFMADNHVTAIRLNGKEVSVPEHGYQAPFNILFRFAINDGFVEGTNVLEFDVLNEAPGERSLPVSPMALRVELDGRILRWGRAASADPSKAIKTKAGKEERK